MSSSSGFRPQTAFVLAAGLGSRMRHLTAATPKPMVPLNGVPLIDRVLDGIADAGIPRAVVNVHYCADVVEAHLAHRSRPAITISDERRQLLDTGGGVMHAWPHLAGTGPFLIHNSDSVWIEGARSGPRTLDRLCAAFDPDSMNCLMLLARRDESLGYDGDGDFALGSDGRLLRRAPGQTTQYVFAGVSIAHPRLFDGAPSGAFSLNRVWDRAMAQGLLSGVLLEGTWMHVGTPEAVHEAEHLLTLEPARHDA